MANTSKLRKAHEATVATLAELDFSKIGAPYALAMLAKSSEDVDVPRHARPAYLKAYADARRKLATLDPPEVLDVLAQVNKTVESIKAQDLSDGNGVDSATVDPQAGIVDQQDAGDRLSHI